MRESLFCGQILGQNNNIILYIEKDSLHKLTYKTYFLNPVLSFQAMFLTIDKQLFYEWQIIIYI